MKTFQLNQKQIHVLQKIHTARKRLLLGTLAISPLSLLGLTRTHTRDLPDVFIAFHVILYAAILSVLYYLYIKKVKPIARDIEGRSGIWVDLVITRKNEFPTVGRYYFFFDSHEFISKEINALEYTWYQVGEVYHLPCSQHSRLILDHYDNYQLL